MVSLPSCRSCFTIQSKMCWGTGTVRETPANWAAGQAATAPATGVPSGRGLPREMAYGPNLLNALRLALPGKQADSAAIPAGVGVRRLELKVCCWETSSSSKPPKKNSLFLIQGPPMVKPPNSSFRRLGFFRQSGPGLTPSAAKPQMSGFLSKLFSAFRIELFSLPKTLPCQALPPDLVTMFTTEPELRPYSGPNWLVTRTYCATNSGSVTKSPGPPTLLSLLF